MVDLNDFKRECMCVYKDERYSARDNGAVLRHPFENKRPRPKDNKWTFGKPNTKTGYLEIASVRIHRIVATAFHGAPLTKEHVVDHIDTNKQNNRPDNLRWVTRLENILLNPITARRIELVCGSIEAFLADPSKFHDKFQKPNYEWMCTVNIQEAQASKVRLLAWAESDKPLNGGPLGNWIFNRNNIDRIKKTEKERLQDEQLNISKIDQMIDKVFEKVKEITGLSREELSSKTKKSAYLKARVYATKQLREEIGLSEESISKLVGVSKSMVNTYLNHTNSYLKKDDYAVKKI
jgi:hypothetical protein